jgi:hypothetical protein
LASASAEHNPAPWHRYGSQLGSAFASSLLLTPAAARSFSFAVQSNLGDGSLTDYFLSQDRAATFKRGVMARVMRGLYRCKAAADSGNKWDNVRDEFKIGMNSNMCDAVVRMFQDVAAPDTKIEFGVSWSAKQPIPEDVRSVGPITYTEKTVLSATYLGRALKKEPESPIVDVIGYVVGLKDKAIDEEQMPLFGAGSGDGDEERSDPDPFDKDRVVTLKVEHAIQSGGVNFAVLRMSLDDDRYALACEAHRPKTKFAVRAKGRLVRRGRMYILDPCEYFGKVSSD